VFPFFCDALGRYGILVCALTRRVEYAYGVAAYPRDDIQVRAVSEAECRAALSMQRYEMWERTQMLMPLAKRVPPGDYVLDALCYAAVTWDSSKSALRTYASRVLAHAANKQRFDDDVSDEQEQERIAPDNLIGLEASDELYSLGLSSEEVDMLLLRFDSGASLEEIAEHLGVSSKQTAKNRIDKVIERCQRQATHRSQSEKQSDSGNLPETPS
jgi:hypothetical protein